MKRLLKRSRTKVSAALAAAVLLLSCGMSGCFLPFISSDDAEGGQSSGSNAIATAPAETPSPTEYLPENPVFTLFSSYLADRSAASNGLLLSAAAAEDAETAELYSAFCSAEAELTLVYATVGMLSSDGAGFSGSFTEAYAGSGTMSSRGIFEYAFDSGESIRGSISGGVMEAERGIFAEGSDEPTPPPTAEPTAEQTEAAEGASLEPPADTPDASAEATAAPTPAGTAAQDTDRIIASVALKRTDRGWIAVVKRGGTVSVTELYGGAIYFINAAADGLPAGFEPLEGIAELTPESLGCAVLVYQNGTAVLLKP